MKLSLIVGEEWDLLLAAFEVFSTPPDIYDDAQSSYFKTTKLERLRNHDEFFRADCKVIEWYGQQDCDCDRPDKILVDGINELLCRFDDLLDGKILSAQDHNVSPPLLKETNAGKANNGKAKTGFRSLFSKSGSRLQSTSQPSTRSPSPLPPIQAQLPSPNHAKLRVVKERIYKTNNAAAGRELYKYVQLHGDEERRALRDAMLTFQRVMRKAYALMATTETPDIPVAAQATNPALEATGEESIPPYFVQDLMQTLHKSLVGGFERCANGHEARLYMPVIQKVEPPMPHVDVNMFLSTCRDQEEWKEAQCKIMITAQLPSSLPRKVPDLCQMAARCRGGLRFEVTENGLHDRSRPWEKQQHFGPFPKISLRRLLDDGYFTRKGRFKIKLKERRILAVILANMVLQLWGSAWIQDSWDAASIFFRYDPDADEIVDIGQPYIASRLEHLSAQSIISENQIHKHPLILSFARLLLELQSGETLQPTSEDYDRETGTENSNTPYFMIGRVFDDISDDMYIDYTTVIEACLNCHKFLPSQSERFFDNEFREKLYRNIVAPLEHGLYEGFRMTASELQRSNSSRQDKQTYHAKHESSRTSSITDVQSQHRQSLGHSFISSPSSEGSNYTTITSPSEVSPSTRPLLNYDQYTVGIICPMDVEEAAVQVMLDNKDHKFWGQRKIVYTLGQLSHHNVVVAVLPDTGTNRAAVVATQIQNDFPSLRFILLVGVGGGVPGSGKDDIRLGDVVVSTPIQEHGGVVQFNRGKMTADGGFQRTGSLNKPPDILMSSLRKLKTQHRIQGNKILEYLSEMRSRFPTMAEEYTHQGEESDLLFHHSYDHIPGSDCQNCQREMLVPRLPRETNAPTIHYGTIGSSDMVIRNGWMRETLRQELGIICVEMEAAGLMDEGKCLVIRGVCDYADSHKNKRWQPYAAATAAAFAKELLTIVPI